VVLMIARSSPLDSIQKGGEDKDTTVHAVGLRGRGRGVVGVCPIPGVT